MGYSPLGDALDLGKYGENGGEGMDPSNLASQMALDYYNITAPARTNILDRGQAFLEGDFDPTESPVYDPSRRAIEGQYQQARQNVIAGSPSGGALQTNLANVEMGRAGNIGQMAGQVANEEYNRIYGAAFGAPQTSISGLSGLGSSQIAADAQQQAAETMGKYGAMGNMGAGAGMMLALK